MRGPGTTRERGDSVSRSLRYRPDRLLAMTTDRGVLEHASYTTPLTEHGYCTDDNARMLVVLSREPDVYPNAWMLRRALAFVLDAQADSGTVHNRYAFDGYWRWTDVATTEDCWGRAVWGLGVAAATHPHPWVRAQSRWGFERSVRQRSEWPRSMAFAALGAAEVCLADPEALQAQSLAADAVDQLRAHEGEEWPWPEHRLSYANAALPDALIQAGAALRRPHVIERGVELLDWLLRIQSRAGRLSVVGQHGRAPDDQAPQFDQQPIEVAALADACWHARVVTGQQRWSDGIELCAQWFLGRNDAHVRMFDPTTAGGFDGLTPNGVNENQGTESTLAFLSTMQRARANRQLASAIRRTNSAA